MHVLFRLSFYKTKIFSCIQVRRNITFLLSTLHDIVILMCFFYLFLEWKITKIYRLSRLGFILSVLYRFFNRNFIVFILIFFYLLIFYLFIFASYDTSFLRIYFITFLVFLLLNYWWWSSSLLDNFTIFIDSLYLWWFFPKSH